MCLRQWKKWGCSTGWVSEGSPLTHVPPLRAQGPHSLRGKVLTSSARTVCHSGHAPLRGLGLARDFKGCALNNELLP